MWAVLGIPMKDASARAITTGQPMQRTVKKANLSIKDEE